MQAEAIMYDKFSSPAREALGGLLASIAATITQARLLRASS